MGGSGALKPLAHKGFCVLNPVSGPKREPFVAIFLQPDTAGVHAGVRCCL